MTSADLGVVPEPELNRLVAPADTKGKADDVPRLQRLVARFLDNRVVWAFILLSLFGGAYRRPTVSAASGVSRGIFDISDRFEKLYLFSELSCLARSR